MVKNRCCRYARLAFLFAPDALREQLLRKNKPLRAVILKARQPASQPASQPRALTAPLCAMRP